MSPHLLGSFTFNELLVNAVGLGHQLFVGRQRPEVFTRRPKLNVLLTELGLQEDTEGSFPICRQAGRRGIKDKATKISPLGVCPLM